MREVVTAFKDDEFDGFHRALRPEGSSRHDEPPTARTGRCRCFSRRREVKNHLGRVLSHAGLKQLRIAETEKYAHVTFFFNGGSDRKSPGEERDSRSVAEGGHVRSQAGDVARRARR